MGPRASLDGCGKSQPYRDLIPGPSNPQRVPKPTMLSQPTRIRIYEEIIPIINGQICINNTLLYNFYQIFKKFVRLKKLTMVTEECLLGSNAIQSGTRTLMFQTSVLPPQSGNVRGYSTLQLDTTRSSNALVNLYQTIQHHISEDSALGT